MKVLDIIFSIGGALFVFFGLLGLGNLLISQTRLNLPDGHGKVAVGFGLFYSLFLVFSLLFPPSLVWYACLLTFLIAIVSQRKFILANLSRVQWKDPFIGILILLFLPYLFRYFGPPVNDDGLSFYLPNVAWIFSKGLEFNPYLTNFTTMPLGIEYLFTIPFGFTGISGIHSLDALGAFALIHLLYSIGKYFFSVQMARVLVLSALLIKGTLFFVFASGKIDTWNTYIIMTGIVLFIRSVHSRKITGVFLIFSIALGIKYTNWLLLLLPLGYLLYLIYQREKFRKVAFLSLVPLFFAGSVMVKNQIHVNNPLAPIIYTGTESRYIENHGEIPMQAMDESLESKGGAILSFLYQLPRGIYPLGFFLFVLIILWNARRRKVEISTELVQSSILVLLMVLPWFIILGVSNQPLRYIWAPLLLGLVILLKVIEELLRSKTKVLILFQKIAIRLLSVAAMTIIYTKHSFYIVDFFKLPNKSLPEWYSLADKNHYAISYRFKELGLHHQNVHYQEPVALGAFDVEDYGNIPDQEELTRMKSYPDLRGDFVLSRGKEKLDSLQKEDILVQYGDYFIYKLRK
ncbi:MAG: hypothetical protein Q8S14_04960 [Algoriphagus sp.]|uniref:hypothetical protein n=1 Tax=Algoriphagus sp. TaxID=1872435 RepID=UPI00272FD467|nr:hypothetical protein [Algoriphagus sp.]MDP2041752.1 hypothetical protein [Algoriphagus sp.]MDP3471205.1 hypothetical protein [Algoriphagus sp.]